MRSPPATIGTSLVYYHKYRAYLHQAHRRGERDNEAFRADEYVRHPPIQGFCWTLTAYTACEIIADTLARC